MSFPTPKGDGVPPTGGIGFKSVFIRVAAPPSQVSAIHPGFPAIPPTSEAAARDTPSRTHLAEFRRSPRSSLSCAAPCTAVVCAASGRFQKDVQSVFKGQWIGSNTFWKCRTCHISKPVPRVLRCTACRRQSRLVPSNRRTVSSNVAAATGGTTRSSYSPSSKNSSPARMTRIRASGHRRRMIRLEASRSNAGIV
jgi:hypothetical protein